MPSVRPFRFSGLRRYTREQVALQESFARYLSYRPFADGFGDSLAQVLERYLKVPCTLADAQQRTMARTEIGALFPDVGCFLVVGAAPTEHKILVDLDTTLAAAMIDRLLGGNGEVGRIQRPLTEIEEGVLSFVLLHVLAHFHEGWATGRELALTLDRFASRVDDLQELIDAESSYQMVGLRLGLGKRVGYVRLLVPASLVTQSFSSIPDQGRATVEERQRMRHVLEAIGPVSVEARVELAPLDLGPDDIANLEVGDIVILEHHEVTKSDTGLSGIVTVRFGDGNNGGLRGRLVAQPDDQLRLEILEILVQEKPLEGAMVQDEALGADGAAQGENFDQTEGLLRDVAAPVVVELGRIRMNTAQVIRLKPGQILRLPRGPNDPVDLVVNGKVFGRGELIEVDGELGVRLMQIVGVR
ncbi:MAG: FliM/FliN family flagellar motor switch protein [Myxococcota bacterium]